MPDQEQNKVGLISTQQAARLLMVGEERIRQLAKSDFIPKAARGRYPLVGAVQGYIKYLKDETRQHSKSAAATRIQDARALEIDLRIKEKQRLLIPIEDVQTAFDMFVGIVRSEFDGLPARMTRDQQFRQGLKKETDAALKRICDALDASAKIVKTGCDASSSDDDNNT